MKTILTKIDCFKYSYENYKHTSGILALKFIEKHTIIRLFLDCPTFKLKYNIGNPKRLSPNYSSRHLLHIKYQLTVENNRPVWMMSFLSVCIKLYCKSL